MGSLQNARIDQSYPGLIKTNDEAAVGATLKALQDGAGNNLPVEVSTSTVNFTGTVTGDNNTTYDLAAAQNVADVDVTLTGSDATTDTVKLVAGTNVTLTAAAGNVTIDAAGGGGAAVDAFNFELNTLVRGQLQTSSVTLRANCKPSGATLGSSTSYNGDFILMPVFIEPGTTIDEMTVDLPTAAATAGSLHLLVYNTAIDTNGNYYAADLETYGTITALNTPGLKTVSGLNHTLGASAGNIYWIGTWAHSISGGSITMRKPLTGEYTTALDYAQIGSTGQIDPRPVVWYKYVTGTTVPTTLPDATSLGTNYTNLVLFK